jgi:hypothetical protein
VLIFSWYHLDKAERGYRSGILMNAGVAAFAAVALPIYFVRTRGWKQGAVATVVAVLLFGVLLILGGLGEWLGSVLRPA